jgi:hypothetical protein
MDGGILSWKHKLKFNIFWLQSKGRTNTHQHLFMQEDTVKDLEDEGVLLKAAISKVPIADWVALLEDGWGAIKETRFVYVVSPFGTISTTI